jgi:hypothetical protein
MLPLGAIRIGRARILLFEPHTGLGATSMFASVIEKISGHAKIIQRRD